MSAQHQAVLVRMAALARQRVERARGLWSAEGLAELEADAAALEWALSLVPTPADPVEEAFIAEALAGLETPAARHAEDLAYVEAAASRARGADGRRWRDLGAG